MDIKTLKLYLVSRIIKTEKPALLIEINNILQTKSKTDWWEKLPTEVQESILEGINDIQQENVCSHEHVMHEAIQKYGL